MPSSTGSSKASNRAARAPTHQPAPQHHHSHPQSISSSSSSSHNGSYRGSGSFMPPNPGVLFEFAPGHPQQTTTTSSATSPYFFGAALSSQAAAMAAAAAQRLTSAARSIVKPASHSSSSAAAAAAAAAASPSSSTSLEQLEARMSDHQLELETARLTAVDPSSDEFVTVTPDWFAAHGGKCPQCPKCFKQRAQLQTHLNAVHRQVRHACPACTASFTSPNNLRRHVVAQHAAASSVICPHCKFSSASATLLRVHIDAKHTTSRFPCLECGITFSRHANLERHTVQQHVKQPCPHCARKFASKAALTKHVHLRHPGFPTIKPSKQTLAAGSVSTSKSTKPPTKSGVSKSRASSSPSSGAGIKMILKSGTTVEPARLKAAKAKTKTLPASTPNKPRKSRRWSCLFCDTTYSSAYNLERHLKLLHPTLVQLCSHCPRAYCTSKELAAHHSAAHMPSTHQNPNLCPHGSLSSACASCFLQRLM